jgi:hypothetical protein
MLRIQSLFKLAFGLLISVLLLTACGGDEPANTPTATNEPKESSSFLATEVPTLAPTITPSPALPPPTPVPFELQLGDMPAGEYSLSMLGAVNSAIGFTPFDIGQDGTDYLVTRNGTNQDGPYDFVLWTDILADGTSEDTIARIVFTIPASLEAGTYEVVGRDEMVNPTDVGVMVISAFNNQRFSASATGTLSIVANGGVDGVFSGEFEVTVGDEDGNTILAEGRASAIEFTPIEATELVISGAIEAAPSPDEIIYSFGNDTSVVVSNDWRFNVSTINTETNPYIIHHSLYMKPKIAPGTYVIQPRFSELDARADDVDVTAYVELYDPTDGTTIEATDITGTLEVISVRNRFTATFTITYNLDEEQSVTVEGGALYMHKPTS